jgi:acyl carrier protein
MEACEVEFSIFKIVGYEFDTKPEELRPSTSLMDDLKADSLALMNLAMEIEERFNIRLPDEDMRNIKTIGDITSYVKRSLETAPKGTA